MSRWPSSNGAGGCRLRQLSALTASLLAVEVVIAEQALAQDLVAVGLLSCESPRVIGSVEAQRQQLTCSFAPTAAGRPSHYIGEIADLGSPIGVSERTSVVWQVLTVSAGTSEPLTGTYSNAVSPNQVESPLLRGGPRGQTYLRAISVNGRAEPNFVTFVTALSLHPTE
jgi:hypothetical protein